MVHACEYLIITKPVYVVFFIFAAANGVVIVTEKKLPSVLVDEQEVSLNEVLQLFNLTVALGRGVGRRIGFECP